jgi:hypothetical protein
MQIAELNIDDRTNVLLAQRMLMNSGRK